MEIKTKGELLAALKLAQIHVETCEDVDLHRSVIDRTLSYDSDIRINRESIEYILRFKVSRRVSVPPKRIKVIRLRRRLI